LHIGHAKAMRFSFTSAAKNGGFTYLRFDDTNPEKETKEFIDNIIENVSWLGYSPFKITYASDYFEDLYDLAVELIKRGKAYVCHLSKDEVKKDRELMKESPYRNRSVEENLDLFKKMRQGRFSEKECCLRMKIDMKNPNPTMRDPVAYRIKYAPHPHAGDKWCIYPTYDYTHCINDSLENITHSLCTLEFEIRRDSYYWLLEALDLYRPFVWEYSRLNISNFVMSKRRLTLMVDQKIVRGWDDPRMPTINGLRRRGYTSEAINHFVDTVGVTRRGNENFVSYKLLEHSLKLDLDKKAPRTMGVIDPVVINLVNVASDFKKEISIPLFPKNKELGEKVSNLTNKLYIERTDFKEEDNEDFFGLTLNQEVGLKYAGYIKAKKFNKNENGTVVSIDCEYFDEEKKTKGRIHWISDADKVRVEVRWYDLFFKSENPNSLENWLDDINPDSEKVYRDALVNKNVANGSLKVQNHFQFERVGYFVVDFDNKSSDNYFVFNLTAKL
jgi:glutaminyl-tRNA synthetase